MPLNDGMRPGAAQGVLSSHIEGSRATALSLLGAAPFMLTFMTSGAIFTWTDESDICLLLGAPVTRIPHTQFDFHEFLDASAIKQREEAIRDLVWDGDTYAVTYKVVTFDGDSRWIEERGERTAGKDGVVTHIQGVFVDVTAAKKQAQHMALYVHHDVLTGLWNRSRFIEMLDEYIAITDYIKEPGFAACLQISNIADIRTQIGEDAGESVISEIATYFKSSILPPLRVARIAKSSFGFLFPGLGKDEAQAKMSGVINALNTLQYKHLDEDISVEFSVSGTQVGTKCGPATNLMTLLETQLRPVGSPCEFTVLAPQSSATPVKTYTETDILTALDERRIAVAYQPIIYATSREVHHYECLLREVTDSGERVSAAPMIMSAEDLGLVHLLDQRALEIAVITLRQNPDIDLAVNVSAGTIANEFAAKHYLSTIKSLGLDTRRLTIELTETFEVENLDKAVDFADALKAMHCRFAIDDFGTGHTTFQNLSRLKADIIKIDGLMVKDLAEYPHKQAFIRMMVDLARMTGVETVAEMVSTEADADMMEKLGVTYFQSYIFGMPSDVPSIEVKTA